MADISTGPGTEIGAVVYRGETVEATHYASIAVVDGSGRLSHCLGDPEMITMMRSSIKPFQLVPLVVSGGADRFGYGERNLSIMAGSHSGTDEHVAVVRENLTRASNEPAMLKCGAHWPIGMQNDITYPFNGEDRDPLRHNCSGKHSGFLALARHLGDNVESYLDPSSHGQKLVKQAIAECCEFEPDRMAMGIDGCSAPNYPLPLANLALGFMKLATAKNGSSTSGALARIRNAMVAHPILFSGRNRVDHNLMSAFPGKIVCKGGAEGLQAIGFSDPPIGIAVKVHDGNARALGAICIELLRQLSLLGSSTDMTSIQKYKRPEIRNNAHLLTGYIEPTFRLRRV